MPVNSNNFERLEDWSRTLLKSLDTSSRIRLLRIMAQALRRTNQRRITSQHNPDGSAWQARKNSRLKDKKGRIKKQAKMMMGLRAAKHMKAYSYSHGLCVGFSHDDRTTRIARVHHYGLRERIGQRNIQYPARQLLGITDSDIHMLENIIIKHIINSPL